MKKLALAAAGVVLATCRSERLRSGLLRADLHLRPVPGRSHRGDECWNPRAGHFEGVRPGEVQNDLDFSRCRAIGSRYGYAYNEPRYVERRVYRESREGRQECWNPRAGHYEGVRPGEVQNDLDFSRCRIY
jgi:hypothetical protein